MNNRFSSELIQEFQPAVLYAKEFINNVKIQKDAKPILIGAERPGNSVTHFETTICSSTPDWIDRSKNYIERIIKFIIWSYGASKVYICGSTEIAEFINRIYSLDGPRKFDVEFMTSIYSTPFSVINCQLNEIPEETRNTKTLGHHLGGYRVGFDLGASDVKVSALIEGKAIFSTEMEWFPGEHSDPEYHISFIRNAIELAKSKLPKLDAIGGSAAGVYIDNQPCISSLFRGVPEKSYYKVNELFHNLEDEFGVPLVVINDGEVTALAGAISLDDTGVIGLALGSSQAIGYVNLDGKITSYLNELAFAPIDISPNAPVDEWSGDRGVGASYLSQQAAFRLANILGIDIPKELSPAGKLEMLQEFLENGHPKVTKIWNNIGIYLGYAIAHYATFYDFKHVLILGRVTSGIGGQMILDKALDVLGVEFPEIAQRTNVQLPDEKSRRVGQAIAAASLPIIEG